MRFFEAVTVLVGISLLAATSHATGVTHEEIEAWLTEKVVVDPPAAGTVIDATTIDNLKPWIAPGYFSEFEFPEVEVGIQQTAIYQTHPSYVAATERFQGEASIGQDGRLLNYTAGQPFSIKQITEASPETAGFMVAWNQIHRWQYFGYQVDELTMAYLKAGNPTGPADLKAGLEGGGSVERILTQAYHRVYLNKLAMLPTQDYLVKVPDAGTRLFKDYIEFLNPFNIKGTKFVVERMLDPHADDQVNTYLPTERRVRRFSAQERADSFMGSNGTLDDFEGFSGRVLDYKWKYLGQKQILYVADMQQEVLRTYGPMSRFPQERWQVRNCIVVELVSVWDGHPYRSRMLFIDAETYSVALSLVFNHDNVLWKTLQTMLRAPQSNDADQIEKTVPSWRGQIIVDHVADTATIVRAITDTLHPTMSVAAIKRIFSVSSLTSGQ